MLSPLLDTLGYKYDTKESQEHSVLRRRTAGKSPFTPQQKKILTDRHGWSFPHRPQRTLSAGRRHNGRIFFGGRLLHTALPSASSRNWTRVRQVGYAEPHLQWIAFRDGRLLEGRNSDTV